MINVKIIGKGWHTRCFRMQIRVHDDLGCSQSTERLRNAEIIGATRCRMRTRLQNNV